MAEHTVNVESEAHVLHLGDLVLLDILDLGGQDIPRSGAGPASVRQTRDTRRTRNRQRSTKRVARATAVLHGGVQAQVVHHSTGVADGAAAGGDLNGMTQVRGNRAGSARVRATRTVGAGSSTVDVRHDEDLV